MDKRAEPLSNSMGNGDKVRNECRALDRDKMMLSREEQNSTYIYIIFFLEYNFPFDWSDTHIHWRIKLYYYQRARTHIHAYTYTHGRNEWNIMNKKIRLTDIDRLTRTSIECYSSNPPYWKAALSHYNSSWKKSCIWISIREHQFWIQIFFWFFGCVSFFGGSSFSSFCQTV